MSEKIIAAGDYSIINKGNGAMYFNIPKSAKDLFENISGKRKMIFLESKTEIIIRIEKEAL